jgi:hypothetical protein
MKAFYQLALTSLLLVSLSACLENNAGKNIVVQVTTPGGTTVAASSPPAPQPTATPDPKETARKQIEQLIADATHAINTDDLDGIMATYHPTSPELLLFQQLKASGITQLGLRIENQSIEVTSISENTATAKVRRKTTNMMGSMLEEVIATFKKNGDRWGIYSVATTGGAPAGFVDTDDFDF